MFTLLDKEQKLIEILKKLQSVSVAFSAGVDSTFLLYMAKKVLKENVNAYTIKTLYIPDREVREARELAQEIGVRHEIIDIKYPENIRNNPENRCYLCKTQLFATLQQLVKKQNIKHLCEGTNTDDLKEYRPGRKAIEELNVRSPLLEAGLTKNEIRALSEKAQLRTWKKPAYACLLTRIPHNTEVTTKVLERIEKAEEFLIDKGIKDIRVRTHDNLARIETSRENIKRLIAEPLASETKKYFKSLGYSFVSVDITGYSK